MKPFAYVNAATERDVVAALSTERNRCLPIAGGTDLLALMKDFIVSPERLVNVKNLDSSIVAVDGGLRIGAAARLVDVVDHVAVRRRYPALWTAAERLGTPQIRNQGTVGGNIMQRPRCWYYRNEEFNCLKKGGSRCHAVEGENKYHAIFGDGPCHIVHPSSLAVPIIVYGGRFRVVGPAGAREIDSGEFFQLPNVNLYGETVLQPNEVLTHVVLPHASRVLTGSDLRSATYEVRFRQSSDWPLATASVHLGLDGRAVRSARVVVGAVAPVPWRVPAAERALTGQVITEATAADAAFAAVAGAKALSGNAYKIQIARTAVKRAILLAAGLPPV
ncbi:MAG TPA: FAD binding domain-containing protein [Vicinamibacterales bacterium]|nr:FAD binding domain-containing protein [Vicinamibacterales bacterium]